MARRVGRRIGGRRIGGAFGGRRRILRLRLPFVAIDVATGMVAIDIATNTVAIWEDD